MFKLDHVIIAVPELEAAIADYRALGFTVNYGGKHASGATHNALICFSDGTYLELLAPVAPLPLGSTAAGDEPAQLGTKTSPLLQMGEGLAGYALLSEDFQVDIEVLRTRGVNISAVNDGGRQRTDGVELRWRGALVEGGGSPFLIEDVTPRNLRVPDDAATLTHPNGVTGIAQLEGADLDLAQGNQTLTGLVLSAAEPRIFDPARTHNVALTAV